MKIKVNRELLTDLWISPSEEHPAWRTPSTLAHQVTMNCWEGKDRQRIAVLTHEPPLFSVPKRSLCRHVFDVHKGACRRAHRNLCAVIEINRIICYPSPCNGSTVSQSPHLFLSSLISLFFLLNMEVNPHPRSLHPSGPLHYGPG